MTYPQPIQEIFRTVVTKAESKVLADIQEANSEIQGIHYHYSTFHEMEQKLANMVEGKKKTSLRFPLVWLSESPPIPQVRNNEGRFADVTLQVWIMFHTKQNYTSKQRQDLVFTPIIAPIYEALILSITEMSEFNMPDERFIPHSFLDHKFLGTNQNAANMFSAFVDARELRDLQLTVDYEQCFTSPFLN